LIEVLIAVSVFSVAIMAFLAAINRSLSSVIENKNRYEAFYYSKELYEGIKAGAYEENYSEENDGVIKNPEGEVLDESFYRVASSNGELRVRCYAKNGELLLEIPRK
jgi:Tfp pilus assembly protein PilV